MLKTKSAFAYAFTGMFDYALIPYLSVGVVDAGSAARAGAAFEIRSLRACRDDAARAVQCVVDGARRAVYQRKAP